LQEAIVFFADYNNSFEYMVRLRWPDGKIGCPICGRTDVSFLQNQRKWQCKSSHDHRQFSVKVGTVFEDSPIPLEKWLVAVWMLSNCRNGVSSYEIARAIGVTQKSAWFMMHRIRLGLQDVSGGKLGGSNGPVEIDETFIGGKARNMHKSKKQRFHAVGMQGGHGKTVVIGALQRGGKIKTRVIEDRKNPNVHSAVRDFVESGSAIMTDEFNAYYDLRSEYAHQVVNHLEKYVDGQVHVQGVENFWSLLKRGLGGTYVAVEPFHLFRYVDEQAFRFNNRKDSNRKMSDSERFDIALSQIAGKRLTYAELTGKVGETPF